MYVRTYGALYTIHVSSMLYTARTSKHSNINSSKHFTGEKVFISNLKKHNIQKLPFEPTIYSKKQTLEN